MTAIEHHTLIRAPALRRNSPARWRFASAYRKRVRYRDRPPERRLLGPRQDDLPAVREHRLANAVASKRIAPVEIPIAPPGC
jgi:hypothetical protein